MTPLLLLLCATLISSGVAEAQNYGIIGGRDAKPGEFPYQVSLQDYVDNQYHSCGGSILTPTWILTAAHCIPADLLVAGITELNGTNPERQERNISKFIVHPDESTNFLNDIALIQLVEPLEFNRYIKPIQLSKSQSILEGKAVVSGWGVTGNNEFESPNTLQTVEIPIIPQLDCAKYYEGYNQEKEVCAGSSYENAGTGDSGGPLVHNQQQIGVVSFGATRTPAVYTKVSSYIDFIEKYIH